MIKDYNAEYRQIKYDTREDYEIARGFGKLLEPVYETIRQRLIDWLPNLKFYISHGGELSIWINSRRGEAVNLPQTYNVGGFVVHQVKFLLWVNKEAGRIISEPDKYFWCTRCGKVHPIEDLKDSVFAGHYCKDCYNNDDSVKHIIHQSYEPGFYD